MYKKLKIEQPITSEADLFEGINCKKLWLTVIELAIIDATSKSRRIFRKKRLKKEAINWLLYDNKGFCGVCYLAGIEPLSTRKTLFNFLKNSTCKSIESRKIHNIIKAIE